MAVSYKVKGDSFTAGKPRVWSDIRMPDFGTLSTYDLAPDGRRLAATLASDEFSGQKPSVHLSFLVNFRRTAPPRAAGSGKMKSSNRL